MIYPMKLKPVLKSYIWGGEKLAAKYGKDGGSVAESWEVAANASGSSVISGGEYDGMTLVDFLAAHPEAPITYLKHDRNQGKGMAVRTGIQAVTGDYVVMQDADLELDPNDFAKMLPHLLSGEYRVVYGSRFLAEENSHTYFSYQLGGKFLSVMTNLLYGQHITDEPTCYKMFETGLLKSIPLDCRGFEFCPEVTAKVSRLGCKIKEVPIRYYPRSIEEGKKLRLKDGFKAIGTLLKYRFWKNPHHEK